MEGRENRPRSRHCDRPHADVLPTVRRMASGVKRPRVRNIPEPVEAALFARKSVLAPRDSREAFLLETPN